MINLLPPSVKQDIAYARHNLVLLRWIIAVALAMLAVVGILAFGQFYIAKNTRNVEEQSRITKERIASQNLESTQKQLDTISANLKTVLQISGKQLLFSKLLTKIGTILPNGTALKDITLSTTDSALDLNVVAVDKAAATQVFVNISDPANGLFTKADLVSVTCSEGTRLAHPCQTQVRVIIKADSSFYFLNSLTEKKSS